MSERILCKIEDVLKIIGGPIAITVVGLFTTIDVVGRFLFKLPIYGAVEISTLAMGFIVYLCLPFGERVGGNIKVDFLLNFAKGRTRSNWEGILSLVCFIFFCFWSWRVSLDTISAVRIKQEMMATVVTFPIWPAKIAISIGMIFLALRYLKNFLSWIRNLWR